MEYATSAVLAELLALQRLAVAGLADGAGDKQTEPGFTGSLRSFYDPRKNPPITHRNSLDPAKCAGLKHRQHEHPL
jgi:hypothetical protein